MNKTTIKDKILFFLSDFFFTCYLKVNNRTKKDFYEHWIGYTQEEFNNQFGGQNEQTK